MTNGDELGNSITIDVNGKQVHKATVVKELFESTGASNDRLRRVRGYSKTPEIDTTLSNMIDLDLNEKLIVTESKTMKEEIIIDGELTIFVRLFNPL